MKSAEIRNKFLRFFESKGHTIVPSSSTGEAAPTSFSCRLRCARWVLGSLLTSSRTRCQTFSGYRYRLPASSATAWHWIPSACSSPWASPG